MPELTQKSKQELIAELQELQSQLELLQQNGNGHFDEDELFAIAGEAEGHELFLVSETGRFQFVNEGMLFLLGYEKEEMLRISLPLVDMLHSRGSWLARVSRLKRSEDFEEYEAEHQTKDGARFSRIVRARAVTLNGKKYVLCVARPPVSESMEPATGAPVQRQGRSREYVLLSTLGEGVMFVDTRGTILESNLPADRLLGVTKNDLVGRSCVDSRWRLVGPDGKALGIADHPVMAALVEEHSVTGRRIGMTGIDGNQRDFLVNASPLYDADGDLVGAVGCFRPVAESQVQPVMRPEPRSGLGAMFREIIAVTLAARTEHELERKVIDTLIEYGDYPLVWRGVTKDTDQRLHRSIAAGAEEDFLMKIKVRYDESDYGNGPLGRALKTGEAQVVDDTQEDASFAPWREQAAKHNLYSLAAFPLKFGDRECGVLAMYSDERSHFVDAELSILKDVAELFAFGLAHLQLQEELEQQRRSSAEQRMVLQILKTELPAPIALFDIREPFACTYANKAFRTILDEPFRSSGIEGSFVADFMHACFHRALYQALKDASRGEGTGADHEKFSDWQGDRGMWNWKVLPLGAPGEVEKLLYIAIPDSATDYSGLAPMKQEGPRETSTAVEGMLCIETPIPPPRSRKEKRIAMLFEEGRVLHATPSVAAALGGNGESLLRKPFTEVLPADSTLGQSIAKLLGDDGAERQFTAAGADGIERDWTVLTHTVADVRMETWLLLTRTAR